MKHVKIACQFKRHLHLKGIYALIQHLLNACLNVSMYLDPVKANAALNMCFKSSAEHR